MSYLENRNRRNIMSSRHLSISPDCMCADTAAGRHVPKQHREYDWLDEGGESAVGHGKAWPAAAS